MHVRAIGNVPAVAPTQAQRTEATTTALVDAARELFAQDGFAATSLDAVVARAGVTKGALYHHFASKRELFRAVYDREQQRAAEVVAAAAARKRDPWDAFEAGAGAVLDHTLAPGGERVTLIDGPGALGGGGLAGGGGASAPMEGGGMRRPLAAGG